MESSDLPEDWQDWWEERAAIIQYDGGFSREEAESRAYDELHMKMRKRKRSDQWESASPQ